MVDFRTLRDLAVEPLIELADGARRMAGELERFATETDRNRTALTGAWSGADATAADGTLGGHARDYRRTGANYGGVDDIVTELARGLRWAKQTLESAVSAAPAIPGRVDENGTVSVNWSALGPNPAPAAVAAAESRARQVADWIMRALRHATEADRNAQSQLARLDQVPVPRPRPEHVPAEAAEDTPAGHLTPVGGLSRLQMDNAQTIIDVGEDMGISERGRQIAVATALQESSLRNLANSDMPASLDIPHEGTGSDHDSVGLFQQRPSQGWGSIAECMDPEYAARAFYEELQRVDGWEDMDLAVAAQSVQRSKFPDAYAKWEDLSGEILDSWRAAR